jgi:hypothetical protein
MSTTISYLEMCDTGLELKRGSPALDPVGSGYKEIFDAYRHFFRSSFSFRSFHSRKPLTYL